MMTNNVEKSFLLLCTLFIGNQEKRNREKKRYRERKTTYWQWPTSHKLDYKPNWLSLAVLPQCKWTHQCRGSCWNCSCVPGIWCTLSISGTMGHKWQSNKEINSWVVSTRTLLVGRVPVNLFIRPWSGWEQTDSLMLVIGRHLCWFEIMYLYAGKKSTRLFSVYLRHTLFLMRSSDGHFCFLEQKVLLCCLLLWLYLMGPP